MADSDLNIPLVVKELRRESGDCWSMVYARPRNFTFTAGMWMDLRFLTAALAIGRTFSRASAPTEPDLLIIFKQSSNPFKQVMAGVRVIGCASRNMGAMGFATTPAGPPCSWRAAWGLRPSTA